MCRQRHWQQQACRRAAAAPPRAQHTPQPWLAASELLRTQAATFVASKLTPLPMQTPPLHFPDPMPSLRLLLPPPADEHFRLVYDSKGRFVVHRITKEEASYKLCKVGARWGGRMSSAVGRRGRWWCARSGAVADSRGAVWQPATGLPLGSERVRISSVWSGRAAPARLPARLLMRPACRTLAHLPPPPSCLPQVKRLAFGKGGIPHIGTHDGRTIRYPDPEIKVGGGV